MEKGINIQNLTVPALEGARSFSGSFNAKQSRFCLVVSRFNQELTLQLAESAVKALKAYGADEDAIDVFWVPGAYEIPAMVSKLLEFDAYDAAIALGVVIQGRTQHAQLINEHIAMSLGHLALETSKPVIYEVISAASLEDAAARCQGGENSRGWYAAMAAMEMTTLYRTVEQGV